MSICNNIRHRVWLPIFLFVVWREPIAAQTLQGIVIDSSSGYPISGSLVYFKGENKGTTSDSSGHFTLTTDLPSSNERNLIVKGVGYFPDTLVLTFGTKSEFVTIKLKPLVQTINTRPVPIGFFIQGQVFDKKGGFIDGVVVKMLLPDSLTTISDSNGFYQLNLLQAPRTKKVLLEYFSSGYCKKRKRVMILRGGNRENIELMKKRLRDK